MALQCAPQAISFCVEQIKSLVTDSTSINFDKLQITAGVFFLQQVRLDESNILEADVHHLSSDLSHHEFEPTAPTPAARMTSPLSAHIQANCSTVFAFAITEKQGSYRRNSKEIVKRKRDNWPHHLFVRKSGV